jgi:putative transposase
VSSGLLAKETHVKKSRFTEAQIVGILKELDGGSPATELARKHGIHPNTIRGWRDKYAGMESSDLVRMKQLEAENTQMRRIITRQALEIDAVKELILKNGWGPSNAKKRS